MNLNKVNYVKILFKSIEKKRIAAKTKAEMNVRKLVISFYGRMCMNPLHLLQSKFLRDEEKIMKIISKSTFETLTRCKFYSQLENAKKKMEYESPKYVGVTILEFLYITHV